MTADMFLVQTHSADKGAVNCICERTWQLHIRNSVDSEGVLASLVQLVSAASHHHTTHQHLAKIGQGI
jgi:hypothetical protein